VADRGEKYRVVVGVVPRDFYEGDSSTNERNPPPPPPIPFLLARRITTARHRPVDLANVPQCTLMHHPLSGRREILHRAPVNVAYRYSRNEAKAVGL